MKDLLQFPSASNCSKTPVNLQSWELTPAQICLTRRLDCLSFTFSAELRPPHPHIHLFRHVCVCVCVYDPLRHLKSPLPRRFAAQFFIFVFILLYLITAIPLSISLIRCSIPPSTLPNAPSASPPLTFGPIRLPRFILRKPPSPHLDIQPFSFFNPSIRLSLSSWV